MVLHYGVKLSSLHKIQEHHDRFIILVHIDHLQNKWVVKMSHNFNFTNSSIDLVVFNELAFSLYFQGAVTVDALMNGGKGKLGGCVLGSVKK